MADQTMIQVRVDSELKEQAADFLLIISQISPFLTFIRKPIR